MKILLVTPWRPSLTGGISTVIASLSDEFRKRDHEVAILAADDNNLLRQVESLEAVPVYGMYLRSPVSNEHRFRAALMYWLCFPLTILQLLWLVKDFDATIIQYPLPMLSYFGVLRAWCGGRLLVAFQGSDAHKLDQFTPKEQSLVRYLLEHADVVVGVSRTLLEKVGRAISGLKLKQTMILPNGAPLDVVRQVPGNSSNFGPLPSAFVLTAGHLIHRKGIDIVLRAVQHAKRTGCVIHLVVVGDGPERENLRRQSQEAGIETQVLFLGNQSHAQVLTLMKTCSFFVLASRAEGMPLVIAEAMACGKAVIASAVDGIPEIVRDGVTGLLVPVEDSDALAEGFLKLAAEETFREELAKRGKELALREYNWESIASRYLGLLFPGTHDVGTMAR